MHEAAVIDWVPGDRLGLDLPAHPAALAAGGAEFLTRAFRAGGALADDNQVTAITRLEEWLVGGTGTKARLSVSYERDEPGLPRDLFVKFSRNPTDRTRDRVRWFMEPEVRLATLSRHPAFPTPVPRCLYADFHHASGTGILITERIAYGERSIEPHHPKCMDHTVPDPLAHYSVLIATLAELAGTHKSGRLGEAVERDFPFNLERTIAGSRIGYDAQQLAERVERLTAFVAQYPHLFPEHLADPTFLAGLRADAPLFVPRQDTLLRFYYGRPEMIALCHWNANIDNAWFWRDPDGILRCGLIDWGNVGQLHVANTIWGSLSGAEPDLLAGRVGELIALFVTNYARAGGPALDPSEVERHLELLVIMMGLGGLMNAPRAILKEVPDPTVAADRYDPVFTAHETARVQLKVTVGFLEMWHRHDLGHLLRTERFDEIQGEITIG